MIADRAWPEVACRVRRALCSRNGDWYRRLGVPPSRVLTSLTGRDEPLHVLQITTPSGFEEFVAETSEPARQHRLPAPPPAGTLPFDPAALGHAAARHHVEILGPPPVPAG